MKKTLKQYDIHTTPILGTEDDPCHEVFECPDGGEYFLVSDVIKMVEDMLDAAEKDRYLTASNKGTTALASTYAAIGKASGMKALLEQLRCPTTATTTTTTPTEVVDE